jgi:outer membrane usher protein FimD/PapC
MLLTAHDQHGRPLPQGATVFGKGDRFLTSVVGDGMIFLNDVDEAQSLRVSLPDSSSCVLRIDLETQPDNDKFYATTSAVCHGR